jgi:hypothetical protein
MLPAARSGAEIASVLAERENLVLLVIVVPEVARLAKTRGVESA